MASKRPARHVDCPICGTAIALPVHRAGGSWTTEELRWARRMLGCGMTSKAVARVMDVSEAAMKRAVSADALHAGMR